MSDKHTPGPWIYAPYERGQAKVTTVAHCCDYVIGLACDYKGGNYRDGDPSGSPEADARLIAAAPELLTACLVALRQMDNIVIPSPTARDLIRRAVMKATGQAA